MGQQKLKLAEFKLRHPFCIFCGGTSPTTTREHCPPRAAFVDRAWPEGFEFPACDRCNGGTSDEDLLVAMLSHLDPTAEGDPTGTAKGVTQRAIHQMPDVFRKMLITSPIEARRYARSVGLSPAPGESYLDLPFFKIPAELHAAVRSLASKLTKAVYFMRTGGRIFPSTGGILFHWFSNAELLKHGHVRALQDVERFPLEELPLRRSGKDLSDQFGVRVGVGDGANLMVVVATFRRSFGFLCFAFTDGDGARNCLEEVRSRRLENGTARASEPFELL